MTISPRILVATRSVAAVRSHAERGNESKREQLLSRKRLFALLDVCLQKLQRGSQGLIGQQGLKLTAFVGKHVVTVIRLELDHALVGLQTGTRILHQLQ